MVREASAHKPPSGSVVVGWARSPQGEAETAAQVPEVVQRAASVLGARHVRDPGGQAQVRGPLRAVDALALATDLHAGGLLVELEQATAAERVAAAVLAVHVRMPNDEGDPDYCSECVLLPDDSEPIGEIYPWPCPTVVALATAIDKDPSTL